MLTKDEIKETTDRLKHLMYGYNYEVFFGIDVFEDCKTLDDFYGQLKLRYKDVKPEATQLVSFNEADLWEEVDFGFAFRGDSGAGLTLFAEKEEALKREQAIFRPLFNNFCWTRQKSIVIRAKKAYLFTSSIGAMLLSC